jgi:hypothetical protein
VQFCTYIEKGVLTMKRITESDLQAVVDRLNRITGSPMNAWEKGPDGKHRACIGNYHLSFAYGGVSLHRHVNEGGGITEPLRTGHISKRELYNLMQAYIYGLTDLQKVA